MNFVDSYYESGFTGEIARDHGHIHPDGEWAERIVEYVAQACRGDATKISAPGHPRCKVSTAQRSALPRLLLVRAPYSFLHTCSVSSSRGTGLSSLQSLAPSLVL